MSSLRYQPTEDRSWPTSRAFQLCGTVIADQPERSCWRAQPALSPMKVSSWRKYQVPPRRKRLVQPSLIRIPLAEGFWTTSGGAGGGGGEGWGAGAGPPPCASDAAGRVSERGRATDSERAEGRIQEGGGRGRSGEPNAERNPSRTQGFRCVNAPG